MSVVSERSVDAENEQILSNSEEKQDFLQLLVAQVQNQEQLKTENYDTVESALNQYQDWDSFLQSMKNLGQSFQSNQALQASALVGRSVIISQNVFKIKTGDAISFLVEIPENTDRIEGIISSSRNPVKTLSYVNPSKQIEMVWDGKDAQNLPMDEGTYHIKIYGYQGNNKKELEALFIANVDSVILNQLDNHLKLNVAGFGTVNWDRIKQIVP